MIIVAEAIELEEGWVDGVRDAVDEMEQASRREPGCLTYAFSVDVNDPAIIRIYERWESMEALGAHFRIARMAAFQAALGHLQPKSMDAKVYEVGAELSLDDVQ